jgi:hypothetical protein
VKEIFSKQLEGINVSFFHTKKLGSNDVWVFEMLLTTSLDIQQSLFKLAMKPNAYVAMSKPLDVNPLTHIWRILSTSIMLHVFFQKNSSWLKLSWYKSLVVWRMNGASTLWHYANPSCAINLLQTWV